MSKTHKHQTDRALPVVIRTASSHAEVDEAYDLAAQVFGPNYPDAVERLARIRSYEGVETPSDVVVARAEQKVVGMAHVLPRDVYLHGRPVPGFGLGHVCLLPSYQGQGHGGRLVLRALELIQKKKGVLAIVIARRAMDGFYWKYGFVGIDAFAMVSVFGAGAFASLEKRIRFSSGVSKDRLRDYALAYESTYALLPYAFCRDSIWWTHFASRLQHTSSETRCVNVYRDDCWIGYFVLSNRVVIEAAAALGQIELIAEAIFRHMWSTQEEPVRLALALAHPCVKHARRFVHTISLRFAWNGGHMVRILDKERFLKHWTRSKEKGHNAVVNGAFKARAALFDVASHEGARKLMMASLGAISSLRESRTRQVAVNSLGLHPVWSVLDEF